MEKQVVSKQRVADHGEVLTGKREVNAMLDLVKQETERIESRFLEPACGNGLLWISDKQLGFYRKNRRDKLPAGHPATFRQLSREKKRQVSFL